MAIHRITWLRSMLSKQIRRRYQSLDGAERGKLRLAPMLTPLLAPVLTSPTHRRYARRPSPDGYPEAGRGRGGGLCNHGADRSALSGPALLRLTITARAGWRRG